MRRFIHENPFYIFGMLLFLTLLSGGVLASQTSFADEELDIPVDLSACTMSRDYTIPHASVGLAGIYQENIGTTTIKTYCGDGNGYAIYAVGYSNDEKGNTNLIGTSTGLTIPTGTSLGDTSNWSMKIIKVKSAFSPENLTIEDGYDEYHEIPSTWEKVASFSGATDDKSGSEIKTTYAVNIASTQAIDEYVGEVRYTMVHPTTGVPALKSIQSITPKTCPTTPTLVYDTRDNEIYTIQKLEDGNCWLLDNLRLEGGNLIHELDASNTNLNPNVAFTLPAETDEKYSSHDVPSLAVAYKDEEDVYDGANTTKRGVYYNFCAASAGTVCNHTDKVNAKYDICPKGWHMPSGGNAGEYGNLRSSYSSNNEFFSALRLAYIGSFSNGFTEVDYAGTYGYYWASTRDSYWADTMQYLEISDYGISLSGSLSKARGMVMRCVASVPDSEKTYLQDITSDTCPAEPTTVYDRRDGESYLIQKLADGNCWFLDNLRLDVVHTDLQSLKGATNASDETLEYLKGITTGDVSDRYATSAAANWANALSYSNPYMTDIYMDDARSYGDGQAKFGAHYNYCMATAGSYCYGDGGESAGSPSGNATEDICPAGWRMPTGGTGGEYEALYNSYDSLQSLRNALRAVPSGYVSSYGDISNRGSYGQYWSSTYGDSSTMNQLYISQYDVDLTRNFGRSYGSSIRCVMPIKRYIQDITPSTCPKSPTVVYDRRDEEAYTIQKLEDNNCWLLDNLRLGAAPLVEPLSVYNTNMDSTVSFTLPTENSSTITSYSKPQLNGEASNDEQSYGNGTGKTGVYYNYCAATAGTNCTLEDARYDAEYDLCPKGWRMPTGGSSGEYQALFVKYGSNVADFRNALHVALTGYYEFNRVNPGNVGIFWSSTAAGSYSAYVMDSYTSQVHAQYGSKQHDSGYSVRCIAEESTPVAETTLQSITADNCPTKPKLAIDTRDNETYTIQKLKDGNCWMLENLRLNSATLVNALTTDNTNMSPDVAFTLPSDTNASMMSSTFEDYTQPQHNATYRDYLSFYAQSSTAKSGTYYNYCAASAGTVCDSNSVPAHDAEYDICPKGWHLAKGGSDSDYTKLFSLYNSNPTDFNTAVKLVRAGYYFNGGIQADGNVGFYWTSTYLNTPSNMGAIFATSNSISSSQTDRKQGALVRCVSTSDVDPNQPEPTVPHDIQDVTNATCPKSAPATVYDKRDGTAYTIQKLEDGNCWMLDNLNLGRTTVKVLTPEDTNITENFTLPGSINMNFNDYTKPQINIDSRNDNVTYGTGENKIGVYYNYCAATAGTYCNPRYESSGSPTVDICPKGWRLPTGGEDGEYQKLIHRYEEQSDFKTAFRASLSGYFKYSQNNNQGTYGSFWSTTPVGDDRMYSLDVRADSVHNDFTSYRTAGLSIRCVVKE